MGYQTRRFRFGCHVQSNQLSKRLQLPSRWCVCFSRTDAKKTLYERSNRHEGWNYPQNDGWSDRADCADFHRFRCAAPDEYAYSRGACVSVLRGRMGRHACEMSPKGFSTDIAQDTESRNNLSQIAATASAAGMESIGSLFGDPKETDTAQFATEPEFDLDVKQGFTTGISVSSDSTGQSAEDVMYAYLEAWRNLDFKAMGSLMTEQYRREGHEDPGDGDSINTSDEAPDEVVETGHQLEPVVVEKIIHERRRQSLLVSSEYVGDEFHFPTGTTTEYYRSGNVKVYQHLI